MYISLIMFRIIAKINKLLLPSFTNQKLDIVKAKKWQLALLAYRFYITKNAINKIK